MITNVSPSMHKILKTTAAGVAATAIALAAPAFAATAHVDVKDDVFKAKAITIKKGSSVKWTWRGSNPHNVTFKGFASKTFVKGTYSHTFKKRATFSYRCTIHSGMTGKVTVK